MAKKTDSKTADAKGPVATFTSRYPNLRVNIGRAAGPSKAPQQEAVRFERGLLQVSDPDVAERLRNAAGFGRDFDEAEVPAPSEKPAA